MTLFCLEKQRLFIILQGLSEAPNKYNNSHLLWLNWNTKSPKLLSSKPTLAIIKSHLLAVHTAWDRLNKTSASPLRGWYNMASDKAINWPRSVEGILCSSQGPGAMSRAVTRTRCQAGSITMGKLGRRHDRSQGHTQSQRAETAWPDMACPLFTLSHRPHTCYADTCMQGFPDIICPAFGSFLPYPAPIWRQINTNIQLYTNTCMLTLILSSLLFHHSVYPLLVLFRQCRHS